MPGRANQPLATPNQNWLMPGFYPYADVSNEIARSTVDFYTGTAQATPAEAIRSAINELQSDLVAAQPVPRNNLPSVFIFFLETKFDGAAYIATLGYAFGPGDLQAGNMKNAAPFDGMLSLVNAL